MSIEDLKKVFPFPEKPPTVPASDHGWFGPEHVELLQGLLSKETKVVLELGSWLGKSTRFIASRAPNATVIAVDHWQGSAEHHGTPEWQALLPTLYETFLKNCWMFRTRIVPMRIDTVSGMKLIHQHKVEPDIIFIDAGHDYINARADLSNALMLFPNATLCGDDFLWPGVGQTVTEHVRAGIMKAFVKQNVWWKESPAFAHMQGGSPVV